MDATEIKRYSRGMTWTAEQLADHQTAARLLIRVKDEAFTYLREHSEVTEYQVQQFILERFRHYQLINEVDVPIVGFNASAATPHYYPDPNNSLKLQPNTLVLIDIWARLDKEEAPYADITWMGYFGGTVPEEVTRAYEAVVTARDASLEYIIEELKHHRMPIGGKIDEAAIAVIENSGYAHGILHRTGHSIGLNSPHGPKGHIRYTNQNPIEKNLGYTIEPGIYLPGQFGIRSEIDFYIDTDLNLKVTTDIQKELIKI